MQKKTHHCELLQQKCHSSSPHLKIKELCSQTSLLPRGPDTHINAAAELKAQLLPNVNKYVGQAELAEPDGL